MTGMVLHFNYYQTKTHLEADVQKFQENTEFSLLQSMSLVDHGLLLFDQSLDHKLREPMDLFLLAYEESGGDPGRIDLEALKTSFGEGYELYIINSEGVIEYTTYPPDLLLDFSEVPWFFDHLTDIREGGVYVSDRLTFDLATGIDRKFVYHPTEDERYVLEISYRDDTIDEIRASLRYTDLAAEIVEMNPYLTGVRIFDIFGDEVGNSSYVPLDWRNEILDEVRSDGEPIQLSSPEGNMYSRYIYPDFTPHGSPAMMNLVAELTYTTEPIEQKLNYLFRTHLFFGGILVLIFGLLAFVATSRLTRPIDRLINDTDRIAGGDLNHQIAPSRLPELRSLSLSLQQMIDRLKGMMEQLQASEEELKVQNEELEQRVEDRTRELSVALAEQKRNSGALHMANTKLHLLTSVTRHDIQNKLLALRGYIDIALESNPDPTTSTILKEAGETAAAIGDHIAFTALYEKIGLDEPQWIPLQGLLKGLVKGPVTLVNECADFSIYADPMVELVFSNLMDNTLRHAHEATRVTLSCKETESGLTIIWEDDGPGVRDDLKEKIFERGVGNNTGFGLFLAREILGITNIPIRETGVEGEGARFEILVPNDSFRMNDK
ncbi:HAMP domain-containing sensor histidine kinase [Methanocalculus natronophilus]|uniref:HAMP domain-containing sensor histidine kinase n=2 Tax=Methanocalculus TaxID=71151 RepID=UPI0031B567ED